MIPECLFDAKTIIGLMNYVENETISWHSTLIHGKSNPDNYIQFDIILKRLFNAVFGETVGILDIFHLSNMDRTPRFVTYFFQIS